MKPIYLDLTNTCFDIWVQTGLVARSETIRVWAQFAGFSQRIRRPWSASSNIVNSSWREAARKKNTGQEGAEGGGWAMILRTSKGKGNVDEEEARYLLPACGNVFKTKRGLRLQSVMLPKIWSAKVSSKQATQQVLFYNIAFNYAILSCVLSHCTDHHYFQHPVNFLNILNIGVNILTISISIGQISSRASFSSHILFCFYDSPTKNTSRKQYQKGWSLSL